jgi:hypothetical protein
VPHKKLLSPPGLRGKQEKVGIITTCKLATVSSRFIHVIINDRISFFLRVE